MKEIEDTLGLKVRTHTLYFSKFVPRGYKQVHECPSNYDDLSIQKCERSADPHGEIVIFSAKMLL